MSKPFAIGIIGTGMIAERMARTLAEMNGAELYAVASRKQATADEFATRWGAKRAYGSYEAMLDDPAVELVYIATPHPLHAENAVACIERGKPVLCEKPFTVNAAEAKRVLDFARERGVFVAEAIWTRYVPLSQTINEIIASGIIGKPQILKADLGYPNSHMERMWNPDLAGGALLDLGVYVLNFASMVFGTEIEYIVSSCTKFPSGVDAQNGIVITFSGGRMAILSSSLVAKTDRQGIVSGEKGFLIVDNVNNPEGITVYDFDYKPIARYEQPPQITGFEYQVQASIDAIRAGLLETPYMPHAETLRIMGLMDGLRAEWGVKYPFE
ncbi:MAG: Gfo/Idh/MocA family oxidoreductase [Rikenellaceae bacterium]|jgi:predicted dehydrogenase|nr:Gfo/Idh/MocA family oxidoreductase [Rikenellaceae bacterium]